MNTNTRRYEDWPNRLHDFINSRQSTPFKWGENDCCTFGSDCIKAITGLDPITEAGFRGHYTTALGAQRFITAGGGLEYIVETLFKQQGFGEVPIFFAQRADIMMADLTAEGLPTDPEQGVSVAFGVCLGGNAAFAGPEGIVYHKIKYCRRAWRIL